MKKLPILVASAVLLGLSACEREGAGERIGEEIDEAADDIGNGGESVGNRVDDAIDDVRDGANDAREELDD